MLDLLQQARARRRGPLEGFAPIRGQDVTVTAGPALERWLLRGETGLPGKVGAVLERGEGAALCLGPDEWLVLGPWDGAAPAADIGHRQVAILVAGVRGGDLLNAGCPLDLHAGQFPPGACTRTLLGKAEIVLWRRQAELFHVEVARSFAAYAWEFLETAASMLP